MLSYNHIVIIQRRNMLDIDNVGFAYPDENRFGQTALYVF
jgi:hypothetical protein